MPSCASCWPARPSWLHPRPWFHDRLTFRTERAVLWFVGRQGNRGKRVKWDVDPLLAAATVDDGGGADGHATGRACDVDRLLRRAACRNDVLDYEHLFTRGNRKSSPQRQFAVLPLGKNRSNTQRTTDLLTDDDTAERRGKHHIRRQCPNAIGDLCATCLGFGGVLQDERTLQVAGAVETCGQPEVAFEQRARASKPIQNRSRSSVSGCHNVIIRSYIRHRGTS